jgi:hypothetical protein
MDSFANSIADGGFALHLGLCSNMVTDAQLAKIVRWANDLAGGLVTLMLDCDPEGENGACQALWELAQHCRVRLAWSSEMFGGRFKGRQPESLTADEWMILRQSKAARRFAQ